MEIPDEALLAPDHITRRRALLAARFPLNIGPRPCDRCVLFFLHSAKTDEEISGILPAQLEANHGDEPNVRGLCLPCFFDFKKDLGEPVPDLASTLALAVPMTPELAFEILDGDSEDPLAGGEGSFSNATVVFGLAENEKADGILLGAVPGDEPGSTVFGPLLFTTARKANRFRFFAAGAAEQTRKEGKLLTIIVGTLGDVVKTYRAFSLDYHGFTVPNPPRVAATFVLDDPSGLPGNRKSRRRSSK